ncbi:serine/threonine-protein kinase [Nonomuraea jabiensis]|uniref:Serine/threonine protein kinase n=1 Tax=Nonomuraea jabiensis TaxID=882448 RepID=A0A7W9FZE3_9ACTN|nr:serine/threonine-protein kinase [Nonomuraea jabiensis]MBB5774345.1 serine/threonine protein kinase [Nonomuraea jabiensis]
MNDDRLGPYRLLRRLGEGGMGVVHLAVDPQGRQVAVKVLRGEVAGDEVARRRLSREVETMRRVRSKYIAEVVDADVTGHRPYIVTQYVPGRPLDEIVKDDGPLDLPSLVKIAHGVAAALASVHSVGVIHRDLKPGNVLILDGEPVLIDFGIAQAVDATRLTQTGMFIGTPGYLAPEIIEGQEAGPEVDVHAWAGTLLFAATGQPPFGKGTLEMIFYNITAGKADVSAAPATLQPLLKAAFQRNPAKRPKAAELAEQTARMLPKAPSTVPDEISTVPRPTEPPRVQDKPSYDISTPPVTPRSLLESQEPAATPPQDQQYVSLLPNQPDPWPTRRVTPEELRRIQRESGLTPPPWQPQQPVNNHGLAAPPGEGDVPTRRVRPDSPDYGRIHTPVPNAPVPSAGPDVPDYARPAPSPLQPPPYIPPQYPQPDPSTKREPYIPAVAPGKMLQRSRAYGVAGAMLLVVMIVAAVTAPVLVAVVAIPAAILLRAADLAQPQLTARRAAGAAALDVVRVFAFPQALAKSVGITLALVLYALILGLPVTLLLTVVARMDPSNALAWGAAVALWTVCAGPGVEGPGKQMRRTLSSLVPSRTAAMVMAGVLAAAAALSLILAAGTFGDKPRGAVWTPLNVNPVVRQLDGLRGNPGG